MNVVQLTYDWLTDSANYHGVDGVPHRLLVHLGISGAAVGLGCLIALPLALWLGHRKGSERLATAIISLANATRALPIYALLVILVASPLGLGNKPTILVLTVFAVPPLLTNAFVGMRGVDSDIVEAARGNGMSGWQVLRGVEVPLALPLITAGFRTAAVQVVATATIAGYVGGGGLGQIIYEGFGRNDRGETAAGGVLIAALALLVEGLLSIVQRRVTPRAETRS